MKDSEQEAAGCCAPSEQPPNSYSLRPSRFLLLLHLMFYRVVPGRRQYEPDAIHPHGQVPFGGLGIASWAPCMGTQNEPLVK